MDIVSLIIQAISGLVGGNVAGSALKDKSLGAIGNSVIGLLGGGLGGYVMKLIEGASATGMQDLDIQSIIASIVSGGVGGGALTAIIGFIKKAMSK
ncbi:hypothetical protein [uncultured Legionella sp.]|uniref:hypothetical protein n=1 Tax=uncultured Legionella sp. TaxID=210934 RepID=UPI002639CC36|nr:hypothetical protein [uncultured Legionella sp.]